MDREQLYALEFIKDKCYSIKSDAYSTMSYHYKTNDFIGTRYECLKEIEKRDIKEVYGALND